MTGTIHSTPGRRRRAWRLPALALAGAALVAALAVSTAGALNAKVLGKTRHSPRPACPEDTTTHPCAAVGRVTGFPIVADGEKRPFNIRKSGNVVAWAVDTSRPTKKQRGFFSGLFGNDKFKQAPTARLSVIKHKRHANYKLVRQSPAVPLSGAMGRREVITLESPLKVKKGQILALTYPTWAPNFGSPVSPRDNKWRSSRTPPNCNPHGNPPSDKQLKRFARKSRPQQKVGSARSYGCDYAGARLLYWAYYVPSKR